MPISVGDRILGYTVLSFENFAASKRACGEARSFADHRMYLITARHDATDVRVGFTVSDADRKRVRDRVSDALAQRSTQLLNPV